MNAQSRCVNLYARILLLAANCALLRAVSDI